MCTLFRSDPVETVHRCGVVYVDNAGIADRDVKMSAVPVEKDHIGHTTQLPFVERLSGAGVQNDESAGVAGAEQAARRRIAPEREGRALAIAST